MPNKKNVYFKKIQDFSDVGATSSAARELLERLVRDEKVVLPRTMPMKVHFGERGNKTFIPPGYYAGVRDFLKQRNIETCYIETNVLYKGSRTATADHIATAMEHGFTDLPIVIADGSGEHDSYNEVEINKKHFAKCKIGKRYADYSGFMVLAHFKGHGLAGFGGAIKQLGMGFAARGGKLHQHSDNVPRVSRLRCTACGLCAQKCPVNAIKVCDAAQISPKTCVGCAFCSAVCPKNAIANDWSGSSFLEKLGEYAYAAAKGKNNIYVSFAGVIASDCDCAGRELPIVARDIGVLVSTDPVAIDSAALDLLEKNAATDKFHIGRETLNYCASIGLGAVGYNLIRV